MDRDATVCLLPARGFVAVRGAGAVDFLQGLVTADVAALGDGQGVYSAFLTAQGKYLHDFFITREGDAVWLEGDAARMDDLAARLNKYKLRAAIDVAVNSARSVWAVRGDAALGFPDPRHAALGRRLYLPEGTQPDLPAFDYAGYDTQRIQLGVPCGVRDLEIDRAIILENNFDEMGAIAWNKGCYLGQELMARTHHRGLVRKRLIPVRIEGAVPDAGTELVANGVELGVMKSSCGAWGLALLRLQELAEIIEKDGFFVCKDTKFFPALPQWLELKL